MAPEKTQTASEEGEAKGQQSREKIEDIGNKKLEH
jgi:hypothetical protein